MSHLKLSLMSVLLLFSTLNSTAQKFCQDLKHQDMEEYSAAHDSRTDSFDILKYYINADFPEFKTQKSIFATTVLEIAKLKASNTITLDLLALQVNYTVVNHIDTVQFSHTGSKLNIDVSQIAVNDTFLLEVSYEGQPRADAQWGGFYFNGDYAFNLGVGFASDPHTFGRAWFPCFDNFTDRATYVFNIYADSGMVAMCNGTLTSVIPLIWGGNIFHWEMNEPIPTYLASVAIAPYEMIKSEVDGIPVILASKAADTTNMKSSFEHLPDAIAAFQKSYGPHSFSRVGFNMVPFNGGAMEHATNIAYPLFGIAGGSKNYETLFAHELAHHWWGNTTTCSTQEDMWLNEGWASYSERIFLEEVYGREAYIEDIRSNHLAVVHYAHIRDGAVLPVSGIGHANTYGMHVYDKGADMVHTLRGFMGDSAFFKACAGFQQNFKYKDVNTGDMRDYFQQFTSIPLNSFFDQWIKTGGFPQFYIMSVEQDASQYHLRIKQNQRFNTITYQNVPYYITAFSADFEPYSVQTITSGNDYVFSVDRSEIPFTPVYWALDFLELISDAVTDDYAVIKETGEIGMPYALFEAKVTSITDSALFRVEHHWVSPDQYFNKIPGLAMSKERYWNIDGIWPEGFAVEGVFKYNGLAPSSNPAAGFLDNELIKITEDSIVLLYRPNAISNWQIHPNYTKNMGSVFNKVGEIVVPQLEKGQYTFGIYDHNLLSAKEVEFKPTAYKVYPNPAEDEIRIQFQEEHDCCLLEITNSEGKVVRTQKIKSKHKEFIINVSDLSPGIYFVGLIDGIHAYESQKILIK